MYDVWIDYEGRRSNGAVLLSSSIRANAAPAPPSSETRNQQS
jgi:hypothetical protein